MAYYKNDDGCFFILFALPVIAAWNIVKLALAICACSLVIPIRLFWLMITIPMNILTGEDHTADWEDGDLISGIWQLFFPAKQNIQ